MCDTCSEFVDALALTTDQLENYQDYADLPKSLADMFLSCYHTWCQGQCFCCLRESKHYDRLHRLVQSIVVLLISKLKDYKGINLITSVKPCTIKEEYEVNELSQESKTDSETKSDNLASTGLRTVANEGGNEEWHIKDLEKLLHFLGKIFLLNFPLYVAHKQNLQNKTEELTQFELSSLKEFCDLHDLEVPIHLLRNVSLFCRKGGVQAMSACFEYEALPITLAHAMIAAGCNLKLWLNYHAIIQLFVPLRTNILRYMCHMPDKHLRTQALKSMADYMWSAVKDPMNTPITFDRDGMELAFKYFTSTTLTMRLAGIAQINSHINIFNELCNNESSDFEPIGQKMSSWLVENHIISHIFGPNLHVEVIKQSHIILTFLAMENRITYEDIDIMWQASQLKHCSRHVYDLLLPLIKNLEVGPMLHLYKLLCKLEPKDHCEQTLYLASALIKFIWSSSAAYIESAAKPVHRTPSTDISFEPTNSELESSQGSGDKSESDTSFGPTPRKRRKHRKPNISQEDTAGDTDESIKIEYLDGEESSRSNQDAAVSKQISSGHENMFSSQLKHVKEDSTDEEDEGPKVVKKSSQREIPTKNISGKSILIDKVETESDSEVDMKQDQEASANLLRKQYLHAMKQTLKRAEIGGIPSATLGFGQTLHPVCEMMDDVISGDDMSISSRISNKSEKNIGDFDGDDSGCDEEIAHITPVPFGQDSRRTDYQKHLTSKISFVPGTQEVINIMAQFDLENVCKPGNTLLWDLIQDEKIMQLGEGLAQEAEKALCNLLCSSTERLIRMKFIEGCLDNLAKNQSVLISLRLLPKLFSSFRGSSMSPSDVALWALETHGMTQRFFQNLKVYVAQNEPQVVDVQVRLQFLTHIFSSGCLPDSITLTVQDIDTLWNCLTMHYAISDELYSWLLRQAKGKEQHALGLESLKHLYTKKLPSLEPESISMVALTLYQQLCNVARIASANTDAPTREDDAIAMDHMWKIALKANITDVSFAAIQYINNYYIGHRLQFVKEFICQCMAHLGEATNNLSLNTSSSLLCIQRALILLKTHLDTFRKRYAYHLRRWALEGRGIDGQSVGSYVIGEKASALQITVKQATLSDKLTLNMLSSDYVAQFRAEVSYWWDKNQKVQKVGQYLGSPEGPIRIIANGQEITPEFDEKTLQEVGFKESQLVYISVGAMRGRKKDTQCPSSMTAPPQHCLPTLMLLTPQYFEQLFTLMHTLSTMDIPNPNLHMKSQLLSRRVWDILTLLPTNPTLLLGFQQIKTLPKLNELLDPTSPHKLMYSLHIIENLIKQRQNTSSCYITTGSGGNWIKPVLAQDRCWVEMFVQNGGLRHLFNIFMSGDLKALGGGGNEWQQDCLAYLLKLLCEITVVSSSSLLDDIKPKYSQTKFEKTVFTKLSEAIMTLIDVKSMVNQLTHVLCDISITRDTNSYRTSFWGRPQVVQYTMIFLVAWCHTDYNVCSIMCSHPQFGTWISKLLLEEPDPSIRCEISVGLYRLEKPHVLLPYLINFLPSAVAMRPSFYSESIQTIVEEGKEPYGPACRDYFWLLCRLVDNIEEWQKTGSTEMSSVDMNSLVKCVYKSVIERDIFETRHSSIEDHGLIGLLNLMAIILKHNPTCKGDKESHIIINEIFNLVFALPNPQNINVPKCKSFASRSATYDVLVEFVKGSINNYTLLYEKLLKQHEPGPHSPYPWDYWPHDDGRADCGYVGLTNLGATCYMASCMQHLFMMPYVREHILKANPDEANKHHSTLRELQKMFAFLLESERKAYNPSSFCKAYTMDHQPLNTGEQKDMAEFFIDLVSKLEEMTPHLKKVVKAQFGGIISNNVVSLDCEHVSCTLEEFYTVRCQVANMRNIFDSLDEVTVKDTLEGDNMYTCSHCGKKVRAEKRACFKKLPQVLCFNTMRYTFNMVTMLKEKVNTHFSFPFELDMSGYVEKHLMPQHYQEHQESEKIYGIDEKIQGEGYKYGLIGITVHTGTADGGHYYCFIRDTFKDKWFLFNDAEVKPFDPTQIPAECFGGEMTSKTYDSLTDKFMDLSFEKTNSAYMLFYERGASLTEKESCSSTGVPTFSSTLVSPSIQSNIKLTCELEHWIWEDNIHFIKDKNIFEHTYFQFIWQMCGNIPHTLENPTLIKEMSSKLLTSFFLETFIHAKEKPTMVQWVELLTKQFTSSHESSEWFLNHMAHNNWWPMQILIKCPNQMVRQMFHRLCIHVIQGLRQKHYHLYLNVDRSNEDGSHPIGELGSQSCVTKFIKMLFTLLENGAKNYMKNLTEYFTLLNDFCKMGEEEMKFLISVNAISTMISFYMGNRPKELVGANSEEDEGEETLPTEKYKPASLERMITLIATLVEKSRGSDHNLHLSPADYAAFTGGKCFPFLNQQIKDGINLYQTRNLILSLCKWNDRMAVHIVSMIFSSIQKNAENCQPFFKLVTYLTETGTGPGLPCFTQLAISHVWDVASVCPLAALEWLASQAQRSKHTHSWLLQSMDTWVEHYLIAHNNQRVRSAAAYLLVSIVPNLSFRQVYRSGRMAKEHHNMSSESLLVLHQVYGTLLQMLKSIRQYTDIAVHGAAKLHIYFTLLNYFAYSRTEKLMFGPYLLDLWQLFHPKLSEPGISVHHNKQALLHFWYSVSCDCPENIQLILQNAHIVKNLAYNYILADHDDQEVVTFNRAMLPAYYGLLRLCCQHSRAFTRQLATHQNITWAFKNISPHPTQYPTAAEELFKLMHLFVSKYPDATEQELNEISNFRKQTLQLFLQVLDGRSCFTTLITAIKILADTIDDKLHIIYHGGLQMCFESFHTLHAMYHEATACHVSGDLVELISIIQDLVKTLRQIREMKDVRTVLLSCKDWVETIRKIPTLLNTYNSAEVRNNSIDLLKELVLAAPDEIMQVLVPLLSHCHAAFQENTNPIPMGSYYPRQRSNSGTVKNIVRPLRPMLQMGISHSQLEGFKGLDPEYDQALSVFYSPYHAFIDVMCRLAINNDCMNDSLVNLSAMVGYEAVPLHFTFFPKLWLDIHQAQNVDRKYISMLTNSSYFIDYVEAAIVDWRSCLNVPIVYEFLTIFFPKVASQVLTDQTCTLMEGIVTNLASNVNRITLTSPQYKLIGDLRALALVYSKDLPVVPPPELQPTIQKLNEKIHTVQSDGESSNSSVTWIESLQGTINCLLASLQEKSNREDHP